MDNLFAHNRSLSDKLLSEWHPTKNEDLSPDEITYGSYEYIWWKCERGHEWGMTIRERYNKVQECPQCLKIDKAEKITVEKEKNKQRTLVDLDPELAKQWHPSFNNDATPENVVYNERFPLRWWACKRGHEWEESVKDRLHNSKSVCPYCSDKEAYEGNCLANIHPALAKEWFVFKNDKTPYDVVHNSKYSAYWVCREEGHIWEEKVNKRVINDPGCPECQKLKKSLAVINPELAKEWHPEKNKEYYSLDKPPLTPRDVQYNSYNNAWWTCKKCNNDFSARINDRNRGESKCPVCFPVIAKSKSASPGAFKKKTSKTLEDDRILFQKKLRDQK